MQFPTYEVPAAGPDLFGNLFAEMGLEEDRYITAIQTRPVGDKARQVVHHALSYAVEPSADEADMSGGLFLVEYASGKLAEIYPPERARAGSRRASSYHMQHDPGPVARAPSGHISRSARRRPTSVTRGSSGARRT